MLIYLYKTTTYKTQKTLINLINFSFLFHIKQRVRFKN